MQDETEVDRGGYPAFYTYFLMVGCCAMYLWQLGLANTEGLGSPFSLAGVVIWRGDYWILLASFFIHVSIIHLGMNLYLVWRLAPQVEEVLGWTWFILFWFVATALSSLAELCVSDITTLGTSGFLYALFGFRLLAGRVFAVLELEMGTIQIFIAWFFICLAFGFVGLQPFGNGSCVGGFIVGCLIGYGFIIREERWAHLFTTIILTCLFIPCSYAPWSSNWNLAQSIRGYEKHDYEQALRYLDKAYSPNSEAAVLELRERCDFKLGKFKEVAECYQIELTDVDSNQLPEREQVINGYAWLLATCPDATVRNGPEAIHYAELACKSTSYEDPALLDTLAAANATSGKFDEAIKWEQKAIALTKKAKDLASLQSNLKSFQDKKLVVDQGFDDAL